jgi:signal peptidase complex subunit 3
MHTVWVRLNAVVFFGLTVLLGLSCMAAICKIGHSLYHQPSKYQEWWISAPDIESLFLAANVFICHLSSYCGATVIHKLELKTLRSLKSHGGVDRALLSFDIHADMRPAFHWNIKQLFVYVVASYETDSKKINQIVVWDKILEAVDPIKVIDMENVFVKYALVDQGDELRGKEVSLQLRWDHMPITGLLYMGEQPVESTSTFTLPTEYQ